MALVTKKIEWRLTTPLKTQEKMLDLVVGVATDAGWTVLYDQSSLATDPYVVLESNRPPTGFVGDIIKMVVQVGTNSNGASVPGPFLMTYPIEDFDTGTNTMINVGDGGDAAINPDQYSITLWRHTSVVPFSLTYDSDVWVSVDTTFFLMTGQMDNFLGTGLNPVHGVVNFERLAGDTDPGTFYGAFCSDCWNTGRVMYIPKRWDGATTSASYIGVTTRLGGTVNTGLYGVDETGKHVVLDLGASLANQGRLKGRLFGVGITTFGYELGFGMLLPSVAAPEWLVSKWAADLRYSIVMKVASVITVVE